MKLIIGITGLHQDAEKNRQTTGAGKDAAAARLIEKHSFVRIGIADHLKRICKAVFDFSDEQLWGPSEERNKPDFRYPRGGALGAHNKERLAVYRQALERLLAYSAEQVPDHAAKVKELQRYVTEWEALAYLTPRHALQQLGTEWGRNCFDQVWIEDALRTAQQLLQDSYLAYTEKEGLIQRVQQYSQGEFEAVESWPETLGGVVFSDVRFHNEFDAIKRAGGKIVRVKRFSWVPFDGRSNATHQSEMEVLDYSDDKFDYILDNSGDLNHLGLLVDRMIDTFKGKILPYDEAQESIPPALRRSPL